jgi:hypothetical protein
MSQQILVARPSFIESSAKPSLWKHAPSWRLFQQYEDGRLRRGASCHLLCKHGSACARS